MADAQTAERDFDQADQRTHEEQQRETAKQGQRLIAIEKLIDQNDKHHKDRMARYEADQEKMFNTLAASLTKHEAYQQKMFERLETRIEQNATKITESNERVIRLDTLIEQHDDRMSRLSEIQQELRATMQSNFNWIIGVVLGGIFLILGTLVTGFFALPK